MSKNGINILIPIGGIGERFKNEGYNSPKPLINVLGKLMIQYVIDCLNLSKDDNVIIVYNKILSNYSFTSRVESKKEIFFIELQHQTQGAAETVLYGLDNIPESFLHMPFMLLDCDNFYSTDIVQLYKDSQCKNIVFSFEDTQESPIYSYVKLTNNTVTQIKEKERISNIANTGCYCFENGNTLRQYCKDIISNKITQNKEYYISGVIQKMIQENIHFECIIIEKEHYNCIGTPLQIKMFASNRKMLNSAEKLRICFDLDKCLVSAPKISGDYTTVEPIHKNIETLNFLKSIGHTIIIYTARRMRTHSGNIGKVTKDIGYITLSQLEKFNIEYDEIYFGKPYAHFYIDDLAINSYENIEKELGFYNSNVEERDFNKLEYKSIDIIIKKSKDSLKMQAEINWYKNIPKDIEHMFPRLYDHGVNYYNIQFIHGLTFSYLYTNEMLTIDTFKRFLHNLKKMHGFKGSKNVNIYANYCDKLIKRYNEHEDFYKSIDANCFEKFEKIKKEMENYEADKKGLQTLIHGDPVFTNIILDKDNSIKMFDMRGLLGTQITQYGDIYYDYAKVYQSIIGYDEILLHKSISNEYRNTFLNAFKDHCYENSIEFENCTVIVNSLLFSMLPLHQNNFKNCKKFYDLISFK